MECTVLGRAGSGVKRLKSFLDSRPKSGSGKIWEQVNGFEDAEWGLVYVSFQKMTADGVIAGDNYKVFRACECCNGYGYLLCYCDIRSS